MDVACLVPGAASLGATTKGRHGGPRGQSSSSRKGLELGLLFLLMTLLLYFYGFFESVLSLPGVPLQPPHRLLGSSTPGNLNVPRDVYEIVHVAAAAAAVAVPAVPAARFRDDSDIREGGGADQRDAKGSKGEMIENKNKKIMTNPNISSPQSVKRTTLDQVHVPEHVWPQSIRNEPDHFETIVHPGDGHTTMSVPKFWSPPLHNGGLMTRDLALQLGSCSVPDPTTGKYNRGEDCPDDDRTIYFAIASYRDFQCRFTVESAFLRAKNPKRIRVGVVDQIVEGDDPACDEPIEPCEVNPNQALCLYRDQVDVYKMEADLSVGPVFARHIGHRLYRGEYYYTQSDAHVTYTQNWDADIISQMEATGNEMSVLTTYLTDVQGSIDPQGHSLRNTRPIMCNTDYEGGEQGQHLRHGSQPERVPTIHGMSQMQPYWAAGYSFSRGHFVVNVPYDLYQPMIFQGEEMSIGIRGFTVGYDYYAPERSVCFHHYAVGKNAQLRNKVHHFWENGDHYQGIGKRAMQRLLGIVHMNPEIDVSEWDHLEEETYGLGGVRTPEKFYKTFGIDVFHKVTEHHLCQFVDKGVMHNDFQKLLRSDGMGVDYGKITYQFKDPMPGQ